MKKLLAVILALTLALGAGSALATTYLGMGTGGATGTYYAFGSEIAALWMDNIEDLDVTVQTTGGSKDNIVTMAEGDFEVATVQNDIMAYAYAGNDYFGGEIYDNFYAMCTLYPEAVQLVVGADSDIYTVADLKGKNVAVGDVGSGTYMNAVQMLEAGGLTMDDINPQYLSFAESATAFTDGQIDGAFMTSGVPNTSVIEITTKREVRLIGLNEEEMADLMAKYTFYVPYTVSADVYTGMTEDTVIPAISATLIVDKDLDEELVYQMTKVLFEKTDDLTHAKKAEVSVESGVQGVPENIPFHPGAERYFQEVGAM